MNAAPPRSNPQAIAGLACSLVGVVVGAVIPWIVAPQAVLGIAGIALGYAGRQRAKQGGQHEGLAAAAIVLGIIAVLFAVIALVVFTFIWD